MKRITCEWVAVYVTFGVLLAAGCYDHLPSTTDPAAMVSMVNLIEDGRKYEGRRVYVAGYLGVDMNLYLSREHALMFDMSSSIPISDTDEGDIESSSCVQTFVYVEGRLVETDADVFTLVDVSSVVRPGEEGDVCLRRD